VSALRADLDSSTSTPCHARCYLVSAAGAYEEAESEQLPGNCLLCSTGRYQQVITENPYQAYLPLFETSPFSPEGVEHVLLIATSTEYGVHNYSCAYGSRK
jgi:hypothetical protein